VIDADPAALRRIAAKETNDRARRQLLALAHVAEGMTPHGAGLVAGVSHSALKRRILAYQEKGLPSCYERPRLARPTKLTHVQMEELHDELRRHPEMNYRELRELILGRFGVHYAEGGLRDLLRREFQMVWKGGRFTEAMTGAARVRSLGRRLEVGPLQECAHMQEGHVARKVVAFGPAPCRAPAERRMLEESGLGIP
jgi:transposase